MALANLKKPGLGSALDRSASITEAAAVYGEMFHLLEEYGPAWYTEELHDRAAACLEFLQKLKETSDQVSCRPAQ